MIDPNTQGQQVPADGGTDFSSDQSGSGQQDPQQQQAQIPDKSGVEKRIDELTAKFRDAERINQTMAAGIEEQRAVNAQLMQALAQRDQQAQAPVVQDPEVARMEALLQKVMGPLMQQSQQQAQIIAATQAQLAQFQQQQVFAGLPAAVVEETQRVIQEHKRLYGQLLDPAYARDIAIVGLQRKGVKIDPSEGQRQQLNGNVQSLNGFRAPPPVQNGATQQKSVNLDEVHSWPDEKQVQFWGGLAGDARLQAFNPDVEE